MTDKSIQLKDASDNNLFPITNYNNNINMPSINGVPLIGNKTLDELGMIGVGKQLLWQNPSPAAAFNGQTVTLSDNPENYDALLFVSLYQGIYHTDFVMVGSSTFTIVSYKDSTTASSSDTTLAWRNVAISGKSVTINNAMYNSASAGGYNRNDLCIPIYIYGVKFSGTAIGSGHGVSNKELLWSNSNPATSFAAQTITLSKSAEEYDALMIVGRYGASSGNLGIDFLDAKTTVAQVATFHNAGYQESYRQYTINNNTIAIGGGYIAYGSTNTSDNSAGIPVSIYGICFGSKTVNQFNYSLPSVNNSNLVDLIYPIGSIYLSVSSANPSVLFGGTWVQIKDAFLLSAGDTYSADTSGGSATHYHEVGIRLNGYYYSTNWELGTSGLIDLQTGPDTLGTSTKPGVQDTVSVNNNAAAGSKSVAADRVIKKGTTSTGDNLPPYYVVYMWKRTA